jgi:hypothetical protein
MSQQGRSRLAGSDAYVCERRVASVKHVSAERNGSGRYTAMVRRWSLRIVSVVVIAVLAGVPAASVWCDALCTDMREPTRPRNAVVHDHQAMVAAAHASRTREASSAEPMAAATPHAGVEGQTAPARHNQIRGVATVEPDCCSTRVAPPVVSLSAGRTDARVLIASLVSLFETTRLEPDASASAGRRRGPPLVTSSVARLPFALRI